MVYGNRPITETGQIHCHLYIDHTTITVLLELYKQTPCSLPCLECTHTHTHTHTHTMHSVCAAFIYLFNNDNLFTFFENWSNTITIKVLTLTAGTSDQLLILFVIFSAKCQKLPVNTNPELGKCKCIMADLAGQKNK